MANQKEEATKKEVSYTVRFVGLEGIACDLREVAQVLKAILEKANEMSVEIDNLTASVTKIGTVADSAIALIKGIAARLLECKNEPAKIQALSDELNAKATVLSAAVTENTPAEV